MRNSGLLVVAVVAGLVLAGCPGGDDDMIDVPDTDAGPPDPPGDDAGGPGLPDTGIGDETLRLTRVVPDHGPYRGGNRVVLRGSGFKPEFWTRTLECEAAGICGVVRIGGAEVQPADYEFIDDHRLEVVVPAGTPGPADVELEQEGETILLPDGYTYDAFLVEPGSGSISGGTFVTITGMGTAFADGDTVIFGESDCTDVTVVSTERITCRTPPGPPGAVDVTVTRAVDGSSQTAEDAFEYYDTTDPFGGGLGGGPLSGTINVTVLNAGNGAPVPDAYVVVDEDLSTIHQGLTDVGGQITFSGPDLFGRHTVHAAKHCFEKTSFVLFDASDVTIFLVPWMDPMCGMGPPPPTGRGRNGAFVSGELIWYGPNEHGPNPWLNVPNPRTDEIKVAYVYTTQANADAPNPSPTLGGAVQRVLETPLGELGYPYRIFARPAGMAVYAIAGLENTVTGEFIPYVMGIARNVLAAPGEEVIDTDIYMDIPLDHYVDVRLEGLPMRARTGPDRFKVSAYIDLGGEGVIMRETPPPPPPPAAAEPMDVVRARSIERVFRFTAQPALFGALSDGRYTFQAGWFTGDFDAQPYTMRVVNGVREVSAPTVIGNFLGIPQPVSPAYGERLPADRILRWSVDGPEPSFFVVLMIGGDGNPAWRHFVPGNITEAPIPDLSSIPEISDISEGFITWVVFSVEVPGFVFDTFSYTMLYDRYWSAHSIDYFTALF